MNERFDARAGQVLFLAAEEARALANDDIGTEHLLLGLLREREGVARQSAAHYPTSLRAPSGAYDGTSS